MRLGSSFMERADSARAALLATPAWGPRKRMGMQNCPSHFNLADYVLDRRAPRPPTRSPLAVLGPARAERWSFARLEAAVLGHGRRADGPRPRPGRSGAPNQARQHARISPWPSSAASPRALLPVPTAEGLTAPELDRITPLIAPARSLQVPASPCPLPRPARVPHRPARTEWTTAPIQYTMGDPDRACLSRPHLRASSGTPKPVAHAHRAIWGPPPPPGGPRNDVGRLV